MPKLYFLSSASLSLLVSLYTVDTQVAQAQQPKLSLPLESRKPATSNRSKTAARQTKYLLAQKKQNIAQAAPQGQKTAALLVQEAKELYQTGQFSGAVNAWEQAVTTFQSQGDRSSQALASSSLALAYQKLGQIDRATRAIAESLKLIETQNDPHTLAKILNNQGSLQLALGQPNEALATWEKATASYQAAGDRAGQTWSLLNQAGALQALGFYRRALATLESANQSLQQQPDTQLKAVSLRNLGDMLRMVGELERAQQVLQASLQLARKLQSSEDVGAALLALGNTARVERKFEEALKFYRQASAASSDSVALQAQLNRLSLLIETNQLDAARALSTQIDPPLARLGASRPAIYAQINLAQSLTRLKRANIPIQMSWRNISHLLADASRLAENIEDTRAHAYALGSLGGVYEETGQRSDAKNLTQQALLIAEGISARDITYRLHAQMGRLLKTTGDLPGAIASYTESVRALQSLRSDLVAINAIVQYNFRDEVEPIYRQLVDLLLQGENPSQENLIQARETIEDLQVAELNNFFRTACLEGKPIQIDRVFDREDPTAALIYPIVLSDRIETIIKLPGQPLQSYKTKIGQIRVEKLLVQLQQELTRYYALEETRLLSQQVYGWLIQPIEAQLRLSNVKALVFVPDGALRNIPMAALHDGQQYLIEKYAIATSPSLQLLPPQPLEKFRLKVLTAGLTRSRQGFSALPGVSAEIEQIKSEVSSNEILLNQQFTSNTLEEKLSRSYFPIVHVASHGQFSSQVDRTFILAWNKPIFASELSNLLSSKESQRSAVELLVLSACETATGDRRAALGLAGVAVRAGARSTLASLWSIDDRSSADLMAEFYSKLGQKKFSKAEALRQAQLALLRNPKYNSPHYWSAFVLLGNWL